MSDILLERIAVALEKIAASGGAAAPASTQGPSNVPASATVTAAGTTGAGTVVNADTLLQIVQPLVQDEATKVKVKEVLTKYNLNRLGEAQESQYPALYAEFVAIAGGAPAAPAADEGLI